MSPTGLGLVLEHVSETDDFKEQCRIVKAERKTELDQLVNVDLQAARLRKETIEAECKRGASTD